MDTVGRHPRLRVVLDCRCAGVSHSSTGVAPPPDRRRRRHGGRQVMLRVDPASAVPVDEQLRTQIVNMVTAGTMTPGAQLPTIRQLASDLGLAKGTIAKTYDELLRDGVVISDGRRGTRI